MSTHHTAMRHPDEDPLAASAHAMDTLHAGAAHAGAAQAGAAQTSPACSGNASGLTGLTCKEICGFLCDYVDGTLAGASKAAFDAHVAACGPCKQYLETYSQTILLSKRCCCPKLQPPPPLPEEMIRAIVQAVAAGENKTGENKSGENKSCGKKPGSDERVV